MKAGVIGAGVGGLAIAIRLAAKGYEVTVYEKNSVPGGKMSELRMGSYRFDTGPSLFTLPGLLKEVIEIGGKQMDEELPFTLLPVNCRYYFDDGTVFDFYHDKEKLTREVSLKTDEAPDHIFRRLEKSKEVYDLSAPVFLLNPFGRLSDFNTPPYKKMAGKLYKLDFFRTMNRANSSDFSDKRFVQLFNRYATYNGSDPYRAPATLNMIAHLENNIGAFFPKQGMYSIIRSLYKTASGMGVKFHFNTLVEQIIVDREQASGLRIKENTEPFDLIISDADVKYAANHLLPGHPLKKRLDKGELSSSALIFYWGIKKEFPELDIHNILFSNNYKAEFKTLFTKRGIPDDPTVYLFISSKIVPGDAPDGCENWFVMVNAPADYGQPWDEMVRQTRQRIISKINKALHTDIEQYIIIEDTATPQTIETRTMSANGALYGMSSNSMLSAFLRHPNQLKQIKGLYFVGGSVHPGGGIPLCLASAKIVDDEIAKQYG